MPHPPTTPTAPAHELVGTITYADQPTRQIDLNHADIPGQMPAGNHRFDVAPDATVPMAQPWPGVPVGQEVVFVLEIRKGQWVITKI